MSRATDMVSCGTLWAVVVRWCGSKDSVGGCRSPGCLTGRSGSYVMLLSTAAAGREAPSLPPVKHVSVFQGPRACVNQEDVFLRCAATSSSHSGLSYLWTTLILKQTWLKREIVLRLTFSRSWVQCFISYNPNMPSLAMHHRAEETFTLSWLLMRSTAVPRWSKVTDEPGWTTWQSGAGMDWMEKHQGSTQAPSVFVAIAVRLREILSGFSSFHLLLLFQHGSAARCCFLTSFLQGSQNPFLGVHHWNW